MKRMSTPVPAIAITMFDSSLPSSPPPLERPTESEGGRKGREREREKRGSCLLYTSPSPRDRG
eukprot:2866535-Rhodomonas_salina.1